MTAREALGAMHPPPRVHVTAPSSHAMSHSLCAQEHRAGPKGLIQLAVDPYPQDVYEPQEPRMLLNRLDHRIILGLFIGLFGLLITMGAYAIEEPVYAVERLWEKEQIEIRTYAPRLMAVTTMQGNEDNGFRVLAGYIFGGNAQEQKIAMTAPVQQSMAGQPEMAFMMPAEYGLEDLPDPDDQRVEFRQAPAYTAAAIRFSGWSSLEKAETNWQILRQFLLAEGIEITGEPTLNQYNPPWTLPFLRRNEIIVPVALPTTLAN